jgi:two-component system NtrC family response regulator
MNTGARSFAPDALAAIDAWGWPGNVRELENRVKRAVIMAEGKLVTAADLDLETGGSDADQPQGRARDRRPQGDPPRARPRRRQYLGHRRLLGISRPTLYDLMKAYDLQP